VEDESEPLLRRWENGDRCALDEILALHRPRLRRMIQLRMDQRLQGRVDPSDVIQDAYLEVVQRIPKYLEDRRMPLFVWIRFIVGEHLLRLHRRHLGAAKRDAGREVSIHKPFVSEASTAMLAARLVGKLTSPSLAAQRAENGQRVEQALLRLDEVDREILALRHVEQLSRIEAAHTLGISESAGGRRYVKALLRLREQLKQDMP
jgi:RNA polymerase sigma-70 factor (ECF subfamily)